MNDLFLDPTNNDLAIDELNLSVAKGADRVRQQILIKLNLWVSEWFLDTEFGTPYISDILGKQISLNASIAALKKSILEVADVDRINSFSSSFDRQKRKLTITFEANTPFGLIRMTV